MRYRRARSLLVYWQDGQLVFENYRTRTALTADPVTLRILDGFGTWRSAGHLLRTMPGYSAKSLGRALRQLVACKLLVRQGTREAREDARLEKVWADWLPAGRFHFSSKDAQFCHGPAATRLFRRYLAASRPPSPTKSYSHSRTHALPLPPAAASEFPRVLLARRTHWEFSGTPLPLAALSQLLFYTWGVTGQYSTMLGRLFLKTSPSGGARHPVEVYVLALRVEGVPRGLYHYNPVGHNLELLRRGATGHKAAAYCAGQRFAANAAALFLMTAVFPRSMWKYRTARAYRVVLLDAGHLCQTFCLAATWMGLAPFCTAALDDSLVERDLRIDGITESVLYAAGVGVSRSVPAAP